MDVIASVPLYVWPAIHVLALLLALSSRTRVGMVATLCTTVLLVASTGVVAVVAAVSFLSQQPHWALSGCTLGAIAIATVFDRTQQPLDDSLEMIALSE